MLTPIDGGFFPSPEQRKLIIKAIDHVLDSECDCFDIEDLDAAFEVIEIIKEIESMSYRGLDHLAESWDEWGEE